MLRIGEILARYGGETLVKTAKCPKGRESFAIFSPLDFAATEKLRMQAKPGALKRAEYIFICDGDGILPGEEVTEVFQRGRVYEVTRVEPIYVGMWLSHWEGIARLKKEAIGDA